MSKENTEDLKKSANISIVIDADDEDDDDDK